MAKKKKDPNSDYPLLGYRVLPGIKSGLVEMLEDVLSVYNEDLGEDQKPYKKNEIFVMALRKGLKQMLRDKR